ncbi:RDD family protein [Mycoplasmopsis alligatoris]|uniref:RDD family protein n=1 Tax=Mycoplasmopsis alligatoris A21JP2 TaxID=747682 RepID=D4XX03_9BACT|nr:RDD family protein [Mycoplasmopsis alligatoris]EFF41281.1 RDD family protein [Mycoplasmopsis alligatoris A21JP2]
MYFYKNSNFWFRLLANVIDFVINFAFVILMYVLILFKKEFSTPGFVAFGITSIIFIFTYYVVFPILTVSATIGQYVCKIKMITNNKELILNRDILKRNIFGAFYWIVIFLIMLSFFSNKDLKEIIARKNEENTTLDNIGIALVSGLSGNWFTIVFLNYVLFLFSKKKLAVLDKLSNSRIVYTKKVLITKNDEQILIPTKVIEREIIYIRNKNEE